MEQTFDHTHKTRISVDFFIFSARFLLGPLGESRSQIQLKVVHKIFKENQCENKVSSCQSKSHFKFKLQLLDSFVRENCQSFLTLI